MVIIGLWHGFTLNYLVFGMLNAVFLSVTVLILAARTRRKRAAAKTKRRRKASVARRALPCPRRGADLCARQRVANFLPFLDLGGSGLHPQPGFRRRAERVDRLGRSAGLSDHSGMDLHGHRALCRRRGAGRTGAGQSVNTVAPHWLQYGVCLFLLTVLSTAGSGRFIYGGF